ncbi:hypothetical protein KY334_03470 [Candidatus Woesearchaeota archaeon]|nr:hypothetical protein [Candidatus Woesearchaeota archaeon]
MIKKIQIFGERNSGTNYLKSLIKLNFENIDITTEFGWKHWFPFSEGDPHYKGKKDSECCLFIVIYRNPFDWLRSFHQNPWHSHFSLKGIKFSKFIRKEWFCMWNDEANIGNNNPKYNSEMLFERDPETNKRFKNVLKLRSSKIKYFQKLKEQVKNICYIRYEDLKDNPDILKDIALKFHIKLKNNSIINEDTYKGFKEEKYIPKKYPPFSKKDLKFIHENLNWDLENLIGYNFNDYTPKHISLSNRIIKLFNNLLNYKRK